MFELSQSFSPSPSKQVRMLVKKFAMHPVQETDVTL